MLVCNMYKYNVYVRRIIGCSPLKVQANRVMNGVCVSRIYAWGKIQFQTRFDFFLLPLLLFYRTKKVSIVHTAQYPPNLLVYTYNVEGVCVRVYLR